MAKLGQAEQRDMPHLTIAGVCWRGNAGLVEEKEMLAFTLTVGKLGSQTHTRRVSARQESREACRVTASVHGNK